MSDYLEPEFEDLAWTDEAEDEEYPHTVLDDRQYGWLSTEVYGDLYDPYEDDREYYLGDVVD